MSNWQENEWSEESLFSAERSLFVIKHHMAIDARHRMGALRGQCIMHIDGNPFNNELSNLRIVDRSENRARKG